MTSIGSIINGGFRLFREQTVAVIVWGLIYGALTAGSTLFVGATMRAQITAAQTGTASPGALLAWMIPFYLAMIVIGLVMTAGAFRAVMRPEAHVAAFLRLGGDELRLFVLALFWIVLNLVLYFVLVMILAAVLRAIAVGSGSPAAAGILAALFALPVLGVMVFIHIRLSPAIPLTILRRKIIIGEAWRLSRGNFWTLFAGYLLIVLMLIAAYLVVAGVAMGSYWTALASGGLSPQSIDAANQARFDQMTAITPMTVVGWVLSAAFGAVSYALWAGSVGTATLDLLGTSATDYAETFE